MFMDKNETYPNKAGIYKLTCVDTNKVYIGKSVNLKNRLIAHKYSGNRSKGRCYFENVVIKYGWDSFAVEILEIFEETDNKILLDRESYYIQHFDSTNKDKGYNICKRSQDRTGIPQSDEAKIKMRNARLGKKHSEETKEKMRKPKSDEGRKNIAKALIGRKHSEKSKEKMSESNKGKIISDEAKEKMRISAIKRGISEETREKMKQSRANNKINV